MHKLAETVLGYVRKHDLLRAGDRVGVAVSGGTDSVGLLRILLELRRGLGVVLCVVHLNHKLRRAESDDDEHFVRELAASHDLQIICESRDTTAFTAESKLSLESAARQLRYDFFRKAFEKHGLDKIATGHTLDDQAETVLLKLLRGAGTRGLAGIYPRLAVGRQPSATSRQLSGATSQASGIRLQASGLGDQGSGFRRHASTTEAPTRTKTFIVRPLLWVRRSDIEPYLSELGQSWREDSSNRELRHTRNRIRHEILPRLEQLNPRVRETLAEAAEIARSEEEYWAARVRQLLPQAWNRCGEGGVLHWGKVAQFKPALKRRLIRAAAESLALNLEFRHVQEVLALGEQNRRSALPERWFASWYKGGIRIDRRRDKAADYEYSFVIPGTITVPEANVTIFAETISPNHAGDEKNGDILDLRFAGNNLLVRNWQAGDRFWPQNAKQPKKIKDLLQKRHITSEEKKLWPIVVSGNEVVWVRGFGVRRDFQAGTGKCVLIQALPIASRPTSLPE